MSDVLDEKYWIWLASIEGMTNKWFYYVIASCGDPQSVFEYPNEALKNTEELPLSLKSGIIKAASSEYFDCCFENLYKKDIKTVLSPCNDYPYPLKELSDIPPVLYYKGTLPEYWENAVAVVGTRKPTRGGYETVKSISRELAEGGITIVSGMAAGLDGAAHEGALEGNGITVAVLGSGVDVVYPKEHRELYERIQEAGTVISEFRPGTEATPKHFPMRNRIVAGLSRLIIAGEARMRSGVQITVSCALAQGKTVFALPGDIRSDASALPNSLIKDGAQLLLSSDDIFSELGMHGRKKNHSFNNAEKISLDFFEKDIYNLLLKGDLSADRISELLKKPVNEVNTALTMLEIKKAIISLPGNIFSVK